MESHRNFLAFLLFSFTPLWLFAAPVQRAGTTTQGNDYLRAGFLNPPAQAKLRCYWWWLNGNTTEETITRDLKEMSRKGFGGVLLVDADGSNQNGNQGVPPGPTFGSPSWIHLYLHALKTAAALHMEVTLNITSGWNLGGPDVTPAQASKLLTWSRTIVDRGTFDGTLAMPPTKNRFYRQIAVLAYPLLHGGPLPGHDGDARSPIRALARKSAAVEAGISMPATEPLLKDFPAVAGEEDTRLDEVVDLSSDTDASGYLRWDPPSKGSWEILRIGYTDSDARVSTSSGAWQGLAIDYLDRGAFDTYWLRTVTPLLDAARPYLGTTLVNLATDSWEVGGTNWTDRFREEFRRRRGYDPVPYLPVISGRIVQDRATTDRFLNDLRRTVGDLITEHYDHFAVRARQYGLGVQAESGGPHGAPVDALETFRASAFPQTEYWAPSNEHRTQDEDRFFTKEAASAADIYGKSFAAEEGMTSMGPQWSESLATNLKPAFDQAVTEGMNRLVWHEFTSSPANAGLPGNEYFAGTHINPRVTWWRQSDAFFLYLNRVQFLVQQGYTVVDVLYFYGDEVPNFVRLKRDDPAHVLPGYDYDVTDQDALLHSLSIRAGAIYSPAGNRYGIVVMPRSRHLSLQALERIAAYVAQGGTVAGLAPLSPTGIVPAETTSRFKKLVNDLWGQCAATPHTYGSGQVFCTDNAHTVLAKLQIKPDFEDTSGQLDYVHRRDRGAEIYFVRNGTPHAVDTLASFRVTRRTPELWNAIDGSIVPQAFYREQAGMTQVRLHLAPYGSAFVIFRTSCGNHVIQVLRDNNSINEQNVAMSSGNSPVLPGAPSGQYLLRYSDGTQAKIIVPEAKTIELPASQWTILFEPGRGAPTQPQKLAGFTSWSDSAIPGIRYFSGTATYRTNIHLDKVPRGQLLLKLSELHEICTVRVNGESAGTIWAMPYQLDITKRLRSGTNSIELDVTNLWPNRIIGDARPGNKHPLTHTNIRRYTQNSPLLPSGLIGPVMLETIPAAAVQFPGEAELQLR